MNIDQGVLPLDELEDAVEAELSTPPTLLPASVTNPALLPRTAEVAAWAAGQLAGSFTPTREETVAVNKARHGVRPVAIWDLPSRLAYRALVARLGTSLSKPRRSTLAWREFQRSPLQPTTRYVVASDIASCYESIDHGILGTELRVQTGDDRTTRVVVELLREVSGKSYGIPQQSRSSDVLAEVFLDKLERVLIRRNLAITRYSDDFRFACKSWAEVVRAIEVLSDESRRLGVSVNDAKTIVWRASNYKASLDNAEQLRLQIADEAELDLTDYLEGPYDETVQVAPDPKDVDRLACRRIVERWERVAGRSTVAAKRRAEHRALVELLPYALRTLGRSAVADREVLGATIKMLRFERTVTPAVGRYLLNREQADEQIVLSAFDKLLRTRAYLNGWQTWWLQQPVARLSGFATAPGYKRRIAWAQASFASAEYAPTLRANAALTLARHQLTNSDDLLRIYDRSSVAVRPVLVAAIALLKPSNRIRKAVIHDSAFHSWIFEWADANA